MKTITETDLPKPFPALLNEYRKHRDNHKQSEDGSRKETLDNRATLSMASSGMVAGATTLALVLGVAAPQLMVPAMIAGALAVAGGVISVRANRYDPLRWNPEGRLNQIQREAAQNPELANMPGAIHLAQSQTPEMAAVGKGIVQRIERQSRTMDPPPALDLVLQRDNPRSRSNAMERD